jgi:phosphoadenosine phosphosulfate reductase
MQIFEEINGKTAEEALQIIAGNFPRKLVFTTSFGLEDQVITDMIMRNRLPVRIVSLDTGRLFEETYKVMKRTIDKYGVKIDFFFPDSTQVEKLLNEKGPFSFYHSVENRKECCNIRKVGPLKRSLAGMDCWITGIRAAQSDGRSSMQALEWDEGNKIYKFHPLFTWSIDDLRQYITHYDVPYNVLHDKGFISIGCAPCTRAVTHGEDFRAGRWWWENNSGKECGLHE